MPLAVILSMPDVSGGLSASADDASWITTLYNVGALVGLPPAIALAGIMGRGRAMVIFGIGFALTSLAIGVGHSLPWVFIGRFAEGFFGGALPLLMMLIVLTSLPPGKGQLEGLTLFAIATTVGVGVAAWTANGLIAIGGWRALFTSQAIAGAIYTVLALFVLRGERGKRDLLKTFDWPGFVLLSVGLGLPPDNATGNFTKIVRRFTVRILLDPAQPALDRLAGGMSVQPMIAIGSHADGRAHRGVLGWFSGAFGCELSRAVPT